MYGQKSVSQRKILFFFTSSAALFFRDNLTVEKMFNLSHSLLVLAQQSFLTTETQLEVFRLSPTGDDAAATSPLRKSRLLRSASVPPPRRRCGCVPLKSTDFCVTAGSSRRGFPIDPHHHKGREFGNKMDSIYLLSAATPPL